MAGTQDLGKTHEKDPTETTLEGPDASVSEDSRREAAGKRLAVGADRDFTGTSRDQSGGTAKSSSTKSGTSSS